MSTSPSAAQFKPTGSNRISSGTLNYVRARNRQRAYSLIIKEFKKSGLTQADLARRLNKGTDVICRLLSRPRNLELDTFSDLLFGICGSLANFIAPHSLSASATKATKIDPKQPSDLVTIARPQERPPIHSQPTAVSSSKRAEEMKIVQLVTPTRQKMGEELAIADVSEVAA